MSNIASAKILFGIALLSLLAVGSFGQTAPVQAPIASRPVVEVEGKVVAARSADSSSAPDKLWRPCHLEIETAQGDRVRVRLGPMRFLMEQGFSPEADDPIRLRGYRLTGGEEPLEIVAIAVELPGKNQRLRLRSADGHPLWRGRGPRRAQGSQ